ncbi:hypothetical protein BKA62DRAFT_345779 [Auriculariales sp. MPI-PUGE-AT-0066]|nr:hypothetical protein BKA62DRAFT_345779 [Auriculariales sp. MPI-PUGE-AT-0066]
MPLHPTPDRGTENGSSEAQTLDDEEAFIEATLRLADSCSPIRIIQPRTTPMSATNAAVDPPAAPALQLRLSASPAPIAEAPPRTTHAESSGNAWHKKPFVPCAPRQIVGLPLLVTGQPPPRKLRRMTAVRIKNALSSTGDNVISTLPTLSHTDPAFVPPFSAAYMLERASTVPSALFDVQHPSPTIPMTEHEPADASQASTSEPTFAPTTLPILSLGNDVWLAESVLPEPELWD